MEASHALRRFNHLQSEIAMLYHNISVKLGLSDSAMQILYTVCCEGEGCPLAEICRLSALSRQTLNSSVRRLETLGLIYLQVCRGRQKAVYFTDKGRALANDTVYKIIDAENRVFNSWPENEREEYLRLTQKYLTEFQSESKELTYEHKSF
jgi:DNA-binding MarR family transcriptional regulator